jgi:CDP-diacylglycerol--glycerol-3-phosphate 3-phosphatidyltransferase
MRAVLNLPNIITLFRLVIAAVFFLFIEIGGARNFSVALVVFVIAGLSDVLDGYCARRLKLFTEFGRVADPFVDKVLICGGFIFLAPYAPSILKPWIVTVVIARELLVTTIRSYSEAMKVPFAANWMGKLKMFFQSVTIGVLLLAIGVMSNQAWLMDIFLPIMVHIMVIFTALSGIFYLAGFRGRFSEPQK